MRQPGPNHDHEPTAAPPDDRVAPEQLAAVLDPHDDPGQLVESTVVRRAAVAAVFRPGPIDTELLFIQRATVDGDPWSGQMAFPGGRIEATDTSPAGAAERETWEEVGLDLGPAQPLGMLSPLDGGRGTNRQITVSAHCYWLDQSLPLTPNREVADTLWVPIEALLDRNRHISYHYPPADATFPGIQLDRDEQVVWGLTLRLLGDLMHRLDRPFLPLG